MKKIDWEILVNHLTGVSTDIEERELAKWISRTEENRRLYERLTKMWSTEQRALPQHDTEKALSLVLSRIRQPSTAAQARIIRFAKYPTRELALRFITRPYILRVAAVIVAVVGTVYLLTILTSVRESERTSVTFNSMQTIELPDGTRATFDAGSVFAYDKTFARTQARNIFLNGEAYFDVAKNDRSPFIIHAGIGRIEVLGTRFNVRAWGGNNQVVVAVQEGTVSFQTEANDDTSRVVYLSKNKVSTLIGGESPTPPQDVDFPRYLSWMKRELYFRNTPVREVLDQLERWYSVSIETVDSSMLKSNITVFIENKPIADNLTVISTMLNVQYVQKGDTIRFVPY
jgi:transmembrane sensor